MRLSLLLLLIQLLALRVRGTPAKHWRRAPAHGVFNVDLYAYNKPRMNLAGHQSRSGPAPPMGQLLEQLSQHSRRSAVQKSHYRNLDDAAEVYSQSRSNGMEEQHKQANKTIESQIVNMQLTPLQMNSSLSKAHAHENLYSSEFQVQNIGAKKIVQLNTLSSSHERKPVREQVMGLEQEVHPLKVELALPQLPIEEEEEGEQVNQHNGPVESNRTNEEQTASSSTTTEASVDLTAPARESLASVKKTLAEPASQTIIDMVSTGMQEIVSQLTAENADDKDTMGHLVSELVHHSGRNETAAKRTQLKPKRKQTKKGTKPVKELETQSLEISTRRPVRTKGKGKGKGKRRPGSQRRPSTTGMQEEIETTTNWWQILPYAEIRTFLNTIYDTITDNDNDNDADERATGAA
ncbi:GL17050 [Drosophila persimilis]|uniref:GL17050 n=1 Tax=Drosophila persimilis TaxID=7234 RepID=B4GGX9_DROPE|nr:GL17050 [Drosophila persimilis]